MKQLLNTILVLSISLFATETNISKNKIKNNDYRKILEIRDKELIARSGCCSHHGGVCGCASGRVKCCDGTLSPSCTCRSCNNFE